MEGKSFFHNEKLQLSQWEEPKDFHEKVMWTGRRSSGVQLTKNGQWETWHDPQTNVEFFYNPTTGVSQWTRPEELVDK